MSRTCLEHFRPDQKHPPLPLRLSSSKPCPCYVHGEEGRPFDKLRVSGSWYVQGERELASQLIPPTGYTLSA